jgi:hypothetical protein
VSSKATQTELSFHDLVKALLPKLKQLHVDAYQVVAVSSVDHIETGSATSKITAQEWLDKKASIVHIGAAVLNSAILSDDDRLKYQKLFPALKVASVNPGETSVVDAESVAVTRPPVAAEAPAKSEG